MPEQSCAAQTKSRLWPVQDHRPIFQSYFILMIAGLSSLISREACGSKAIATCCSGGQWNAYVFIHAGTLESIGAHSDQCIRAKQKVRRFSSPLNCCWLEEVWPGRAAARALWLTEDTRELSALTAVTLCARTTP